MPRLDRTFKALAEADPDSLVRLVCDIPWDRHLDIHHVDREMIIPSRPVDHTYEVAGSEGDFVLHLEAFAYADHEAADQQIWHAALIVAKLRRAIRSRMILLSPRYPGNLLDPPVELGLGDLHLRLDYQRIRMWTKDPAQVLSVDRPYLLPWVGAMNSTQADIREAARRIRLIPDRKLSRRLMSELSILLGIRYTREEIEAFTGDLKMLLTEEVVKESIPVQEYAEKVRHEGELAGRKQGQREGRELGQREGREQGQIAQARESVARALRSRFPKSQPIIELDKIASLEELNRLFDRAITAKTITEFRRALAAATATNGH